MKVIRKCISCHKIYVGFILENNKCNEVYLIGNKDISTICFCNLILELYKIKSNFKLEETLNNEGLFSKINSKLGKLLYG